MGKASKLIGFLVLVIAFLIFEGIVQFDIFTDIQAHIEFIQMIQSGTTPPPNFLFYFIVFLFSFFSSSTTVLLQSAVVVLSLSILLKFYFSLKVLSVKSISSTNGLFQNSRLPPLFIAMLCLSFAIPNPFNIFYYLGQTPPNIWHNSTIIFLMPFAILLFWQSVNYVQNPSKKLLLNLCLLVFLNAIIKPSFIMVFVPAFSFISLLKNKFSKTFFISLIPSIFATVLILLQFLLVFILEENSIYEKAEKTSVLISPFEVWSYFSRYIPLSILVSVAFPLAVSIVYFKKLKHQLMFQYSWLCYFIAITIFALLVEAGPRKLHLNFSWQNIVCCYILFLVTGKYWIQYIQERNKLFKADFFILGIFILHFLSGLAYILRLFLRNTYY